MLVGSTVGMLLNHATYGQLHEYLRAIGLSLRGHCCGICCPVSGSFFGRLWRNRGLGPNTNPVPQHGRSSFRASQGCHVDVSPSAGPQFGRQHNTPGRSLDQPSWCQRELLCRLFDRRAVLLYSRRFVNIDINSDQLIDLSRRVAVFVRCSVLYATLL